MEGHVINSLPAEAYTWQRSTPRRVGSTATAGDVASVSVIADPRPHDFRVIGVGTGGADGGD